MRRGPGQTLPLLLAFIFFSAFGAASPVKKDPTPAARKLLWTYGPATPPMSAVPCPKTPLPTPTTAVTIWVDPAFTGTSSGNVTNPFKDFTTAWRRIPKNTPLTTAYIINIKPGLALKGRLWMEAVWGTREFPVIVQQAPGTPSRTAMLQIIDVSKCSFLYFSNLLFHMPPCSVGCSGNVVHFAFSDYIHLLNVTVAGVYNSGYPGTNQALKVNQVTGMYVEDSEVYGSAAGGVGMDMVAVQYGHICRTEIHHADWCVYFKGGSSYLLLDSNHVHDCGQSGLATGQGTGFEYMVAPWIQYEAYWIKVVNNIIHDVWGAGLGVFGGYAILMAHNTLFRVGTRSHMVEFQYGTHSCSYDNTTCTSLANMGGWGLPTTGTGSLSIPTKNVYFYNNLVVNPPGVEAKWAHFSLGSSPVANSYPPSMPTPITVIQGLTIAGNVHVNFHNNTKIAMSLGLTPCTANFTGCYQPNVLANNLINKPGLSITFASPTTLALTQETKAALLGAAYKLAVIPAYTSWSTAPVQVPAGVLSNDVPVDRNGVPKTADNTMPGAWTL